MSHPEADLPRKCIPLVFLPFLSPLPGIWSGYSSSSWTIEAQSQGRQDRKIKKTLDHQLTVTMSSQQWMAYLWAYFTGEKKSWLWRINLLLLLQVFLFNQSNWMDGSLSLALVCDNTAKCTMKMGIVGKYRFHYRVSLRKIVKKVEKSQHAKYARSFYGKTKRKMSCGDLDLWFLTRGAWTYNISAITVKWTLKEFKDQQKSTIWNITSL